MTPGAGWYEPPDEHDDDEQDMAELSLWLRAIGRVALYVPAVAALGGTILAVGAAFLWVTAFYPAQFTLGMFAVVIVVGLGAMVKGEHDRIAEEDD